MGISEQCIYIRVSPTYHPSTFDRWKVNRTVSLTKPKNWQESKILLDNCRAREERLFAIFTVDQDDREIRGFGEVTNITFSGDYTTIWFFNVRPTPHITNSRSELLVWSTQSLLPVTWDGDHAVCETPEWLEKLVETFT